MKPASTQIIITVIALLFSVTAISQSAIQIDQTHFVGGTYGKHSEIGVRITTNNCFLTNNVFRMYLSDSSGSFAHETLIGEYAGFFTTLINGVIPDTVQPGNNYRIRIKSTQPASTSNPSPFFKIVTNNNKVVAKVNAQAKFILKPNLSYGFCSVIGTSNTISFFDSTSGSNSNSYTLINEITGATITNNFSGNFSLTNLPTNYFTLIVSATSASGVVSSRAYHIINNKNRLSLSTSGEQQGCLPDSLQFLITIPDASGGIEYNYPGLMYSINWGDGSPTEVFTHCQLIKAQGVIKHLYQNVSCNPSGGISSFDVTTKLINPWYDSTGSGTVKSCDRPELITKAKIFEKPVADFNVPSTGCINMPVVFTNTSNPGNAQDGSNCNKKAYYTWYINGNIVLASNETDTLPNLIYSFTTPGYYEVELEVENISCGSSKKTSTICIEPSPEPDFLLKGSDSIIGCAPLTFLPANLTKKNPCRAMEYLWIVTMENGSPVPQGAYTAVPSLTDSIPMFSFALPGRYLLQLQAKNSCGTFLSPSKKVIVLETTSVEMPPSFEYCGIKTIDFGNNLLHKPNFSGGQQETFSWQITPSTYHYVNGSSTSKGPVISFDNVGQYLVKITYNNSCNIPKTDSQIIVFNPVPVINPVSNKKVCAGDSIPLINLSSVISNANIKWVISDSSIGYPSGGSKTIPAILAINNTGFPKTVQVTVFANTSKCFDTLVFNITVNPKPQKPQIVSPDVYCIDDVALPIKAFAAQNNTLTYFNNSGLANGQSSPYTPSTSTVSVQYFPVLQTNNYNCKGDTAQIVVIVKDSISNNRIKNNQTICANTAPNEFLQASGTVGGGDGSQQYQWQVSNDSVTWTNIAFATGATYQEGIINSTKYYRRMVTSGPCTNTSNVIKVTVLGQISNYNISSNQIICSGSLPSNIIGQVPVGGEGTYAYQWQQSTDGINYTDILGANAKDFQPPALTSTTYYRRAVSSGICAALSNVVTIKVNPLPEATVQAQNGNNCQADPTFVTLNAIKGDGPFTVHLLVNFPDGSTDTIRQNNVTSGSVIQILPANAAAGTYSVSIIYLKDNNGCVNNNITPPITITVKPNPQVLLNADTAICEGSSVTLNASGAASYSWSPATGLNTTTGTTVIASPLGTQTYSVTGTTDGCSSTRIIKITVNPRPQKPVVQTPVIYCLNDVAVPLTATGTQLLWYDNILLQNGNAVAPTPSTNAAATKSYFVTQTNAFNCESQSSEIVVTVLDAISGNEIKQDDTICAGTAPQVLTGKFNLTGGDQTNYSYQWQQSVDNGNTWTNILGAVSASYSSPSLQVTTWFRRIVVSGACTSTSNNIIITVEGALENNVIAAHQTICYNEIPNQLTGSMPNGGINAFSYQWQVSADGLNYSDITGTNSQNYQPQNLISNTYFRRAVFSGACSSFSNAVLIKVNPKSILNPVNDLFACSNETVNKIQFSSSLINNTTFHWVNNNPDIGLPSTGNGSINSFNAINNKADKSPEIAAVKVFAVYTADGKSCTTDSLQFTIAVLPAINILNAKNDTVCANEIIADFVPNTDASTFSGSSVDYNYFVSGNGISLINGTGNNVPSFSTFNTGNTVLEGIITLVPNYHFNGKTCQGNPVIYKVVVKPRPSINDFQTNVCSNDSFNYIILNQPPDIVPSNTKYTWNAPVMASGLSGGTGGNMELSIKGLLHNSTHTGLDALYTVTPNADGCIGNSFQFKVTVNPKPILDTIKKSVCNNETFVVNPQNGVPSSSIIVPPGTTYSWPAPVVTGNMKGGAGGQNQTSINGKLFNNTNQVQTATYMVTPKAGNCIGNPFTVVVQINPSVTVSFNPISDQTICSNTSSQQVNIQSSFDDADVIWTSNVPQGITGAAINGTDIVPAQTLINQSSTSLTVVYTATASTKSGAVCQGIPAEYKITVLPVPSITASPLISEICSGAFTDINITSNVSSAAFNWEVSNNPNITGASNGSSNNIKQSLQNTSNTPQSIQYSIYSNVQLNNVTCKGDSVKASVTVLPVPGIHLPPNQTICSGTSFNDVNLISDVSGAVFNWTATAPSTVTGYVPGGINTNIISGVSLFNSSSSPQHVVYTITPLTGQGINSCQGNPVVYTVTVYPSPKVIINLPDQIICSNQSTQPVTLSSSTGGVNFSWSVITNGATGINQTSGNTNIIPSETISNSTNAPIDVVYKIKAITSGDATCTGNDTSYKITVNPIPDVMATPASQAICTNTSTQIALSSSVSSTEFEWTVVANGGVTGATNGNGNTIQQTLVNNGVNPATVIYTVTPKYGQQPAICSGNSIDVVITVNPIAAITNSPLMQEVCTNVSTSPVNWTSFTPGTTFQWNIQTNDGITGFPASGTGNLPSMTLQNPNDVQGSVLISVTSSVNQCSGPPTIYTIKVNPDAKAAVSVIKDSACAPFNINNSIIKPVLYTGRNESYKWYADDVFYGSNASANPGYILANEGDSVTIKMVAVSLYGCKNDSVSHRFFTIPKPVTRFEASDTVGCGPLVVSFTNTTPNREWFNYFWDFGNGQTFTGKQPGPISFSANPNFGDTIYKVTLSAFTECDTIKTMREIRVKSKPKAIMTPDKTFGCSPFTVNFSNTSKGLNNTYKWIFGDGNSQTISGPSDISHTYHAGTQDTLKAKLVASNECGADTMEYKIVIAPNTIHLDFAINGNQYSGCSPHEVVFINNSSGATAFFWNFGDGNVKNTTKNIDSITHIFSAPGNYNVVLKATNGCTDTTSVEQVYVFKKPIVDFAAVPAFACVGDSIHFINQTDSFTNVLWIFGNGITSTKTNPALSFSQPGMYEVKLIASVQYAQGNACSDSAIKQINIVPSLPGSFHVNKTNINCLPETLTFTNNSLPSIHTEWDFGDGSFSTGNVVTHQFTKNGNYWVKMKAKDPGGCFYIDSVLIVVNAPQGSLQYNAGFVCSSSSVKFEVVGSGFDSLRWHFGDGFTQVTTATVVYHTYQQSGKVLPYVELIKSPSCNVLLKGADSIKVEYLKAGFSFTQNQLCDSTSYQFTDTSSGLYPINGYKWFFGDGNSSINKNPFHSYYASASYSVQQIVYSESGCTDTAKTIINVKVNNVPDASILTPSLACTDRDITLKGLVNSTDSINSLIWKFDNGLTIYGNTATIQKANPGMVAVKFIAATSFGCYDTATANIEIFPTPKLTISDDKILCKGSGYSMHVSGANSYLWNPSSTLNCSTCDNPIATPLQTTQYIVEGKNQYGCSALDTVLVEVAQPIQVSVTGNDTLCINQTTQLFADGAERYEWWPHDGLSSSQIPNPIVNVNQTTKYQVIGFDKHNCFRDTAYITVAVGKQPILHIGSDTILSTGTLYQFLPSISEGPVKRWEWSPSKDLDCSTCAAPAAVIKTDVCYTAKATTIFGCTVSDTMCIKVFCEGTQVFIPNVFTPLQNTNNRFTVRGSGILNIKSFRVFNRWGQLVFERNNVKPNDPKSGWDGKVNGQPASPDVYVYIAEVVCENGTTYSYKGNVTLLK